MSGVPQHGGTWTWRVRFRTGPDIVATGSEGGAVAGVDGSAGSLTVGSAPRNPVRARGLLRYTGESHYRWSGDGSVYFKVRAGRARDRLRLNPGTGA